MPLQTNTQTKRDNEIQQTNLLVTLSVFLRHLLKLGPTGARLPPLAQLLGNISNTVVGILCSHFRPLLVTEAEERRPAITQSHLTCAISNHSPMCSLNNTKLQSQLNIKHHSHKALAK